MDFLRQYLAAVQHYTRVPLRGAMGELPPARAMFLPGVGWLVGIAACVSFAALSLLLPDVTFTPLAAAIGSTIATIVLTGAQHEDGIVDLWGSFALSLAVLAKVALLAVLAGQSQAGVLAALLAAHTLSRFAAVALPEPVDKRSVGIAAAWCVIPLVLAVLVRGTASALVAVVVAALAWWGMKRWVSRETKLDVATGATQQVCEIAFYLGAAIA